MHEHIDVQALFSKLEYISKLIIIEVAMGSLGLGILDQLGILELLTLQLLKSEPQCGCARLLSTILSSSDESLEHVVCDVILLNAPRCILVLLPPAFKVV
jgi:hypothetical protein